MGRWDPDLGEVTELVSPRLLRLAYLLIGDEGQARKLVADVLRRYADRPAPGDHSPYAYARSLLVQQVVRPRLPRPGRRPSGGNEAASPAPASPQTPAPAPLPADPTPDAAEELQRAEAADCAILAAAVLDLPVRTRLVAVLAQDEQLAAETIADDVGCTVRTVRRERDRALATLTALPVPAPLAGRSIEERLTAALDHRAAQIDADLPVAPERRSGGGRGRRLALAVAAALIFVAGAVVLRPQSPDSPDQRPTPASPGQTVTPSATQADDAAWPIRGPLAADRIFIAEMTRKIAQTKSPDAPAMVILYAGDINDKRLVLAGGIEDLGFGRSARRVETYIGPRGASAQTMVGESSDMHTQLDPAEPLVYVPDWNAPRWVLILAPPRRTQFGVSDNPHYALDGTPSRTFRPVDLSHGFAVVPITSRLASNLVLEYRSNPAGTAQWRSEPRPMSTATMPWRGSRSCPRRPPMPSSGFPATATATVRPCGSASTKRSCPSTEWVWSDDPSMSVVFAVIRRADGTAYRTIEVRSRSQSGGMAPVVCAPVPAATADLLP